MQQTGLTLRQAQRFFHFRERVSKAHFVGWSNPTTFNPCGQRILSSSTSGDDRLPGALFVEGELHALHSFQLAVWGVGRIHGMASDGDDYFAKPGDAWSDNYEWTGAWNRWCGHKAALQVNGVSIAVLGNGLKPFIPAAMLHWLPVYLSKVVPRLGISPRCSTPCLQFPTKKRIISGLSKGVLVVEAALRSGRW